MQPQEVIELIKVRDESGIQALLTHFGPLLRYVIAPILADDADREECLSECAMRVWDSIDSFDERRGSWTAWLTAIARDAALNRARARRSSAASLSEVPEDTPAAGPGPEEVLLLKERREALMRAISRLGIVDRNLFYRKYYYMQSTAQIAAETGTTERAVEGRLHRLRKKLRRELGGELGE